MKKLRIILSAILILTIVSGLAACGKTQEAETTAAPGADSSVSETASEAESETAGTGVTETEAPSEEKPEPVSQSGDAEKALEFYMPTVEAYYSERASRAKELGYDITVDEYLYAVKDINLDGVYELVIAEDLEDRENITGIYTCVDGKAVELAFIQRHGSYFISSDGYIGYVYKWIELYKISGGELVTIASGDVKTNSSDYDEQVNAFLRKNGVSNDYMEFDYKEYKK